MSKQVIVEDYNPLWAQHFQEIKDVLWTAVNDFALSIEHVGSTSVPGLAAKPVIDVDIIIRDMSFLDRTVAALNALGYEHRGNLGIVEREAFRASNPARKHNLYVCPKDSISLRNHLCLRDALRINTELRDQYSELKKQLAAKFPDSIDDYVEGKTDFILNILKDHGYGPDSLKAIRMANLAPAKK